MPAIKVKNPMTGSVFSMEVDDETTAEEMVTVALNAWEMSGMPFALRQGLKVIRNGATGLHGEYEIFPDPIGGIMVNVEDIFDHKYCECPDSEFEYPDEYTLWAHSLYLGGRIPSEWLEKFVETENSDILGYVVIREDLPIKWLEWLAECSFPEIRKIVARSSRLSTEKADLFLSDDSPAVRAAVAQRPDLSKKNIMLLVGDVSASVRSSIANHIDLPTEGMKKLLTDPNEYVRWMIAFRDDLPSEIRGVLMKDSNSDVRRAASMYSRGE